MHRLLRLSFCVTVLFLLVSPVTADEPVTQATIDGTGPGWRELGEADFVNVNCDPDTWTWKDGVAHCTGQPVGVIRTKSNTPTSNSWRVECI